MCISQFLLEDNEYTLGVFDSAALFAMADQDAELLAASDVVRLTPSVSRNAEIEVLWAA